MKDLIYYPSFEPTDLDWLKYSMIYLDSFSPIMPPRGSSELSDIFNKLRNETDLITFHGPSNSESESATNNILDQLKDLNSAMENGTSIVEFLALQEKWREVNYWDTTLYQEKFSRNLFDFCVSEGYGRKSGEDLICSHFFSDIYMSLYADEVALTKNTSTITDLENLFISLDKFRKLKPDAEVEFAKAVIKVKSPNLKEMEFEKLITFRNEKDTSDLRKTFNSEINIFLNKTATNPAPYDFIEEFDKASKEYYTYLGKYWGNTSIEFGLTGIIPLTIPIPILNVAAITYWGIKLAYSADSYNLKYSALKNRKDTKQFLTIIPKMTN